MARRWSLPESFAELIEVHASFEELVSAGATAGQVAVSLSALLPSVQDNAWHEREQFVDAFQRLTHKETAELAGLLGEIDAGFDEFAPVLKLATPAQSLAASLEPAEAPAT